MVLTAKKGLTLKPNSSRLGTSQGQDSFYLGPPIFGSKLSFPNDVHGLPFSGYTENALHILLDPTTMGDLVVPSFVCPIHPL
jgi:hypothetical protein